MVDSGSCPRRGAYPAHAAGAGQCSL